MSGISSRRQSISSCVVANETFRYLRFSPLRWFFCGRGRVERGERAVKRLREGRAHESQILLGQLFHGRNHALEAATQVGLHLLFAVVLSGAGAERVRRGLRREGTQRQTANLGCEQEVRRKANLRLERAPVLRARAVSAGGRGARANNTRPLAAL